jgi:hypothetical protein
LTEHKIMSVISFAFRNNTALRIANLITGDIERLERDVFGTVTNWQSKYERPFKAHYANDLAVRADANARAAEKLAEYLPKYEARAEAYSNNPNKKGRPLTTFINMDDPTANNQEPEPVDNADDELAGEIAAILSDDIPVPQGAKRSQGTAAQPQNLPAKAAPVPTLPEGMPEGAQAALAALMAALTPQAPAIDEAQVRAIARDEANKTVKPTIVTVHHKDPDGTTTAQDLGMQHKLFPTLIKAMQAGFPIWMPGPAGSGKTTAAKHAAKAFDIAFHHTGAVDNVYQLLGFIDAGGTYHRTTFREAYENGGVFLWDEVDASNPAALVAFNAALENGECVFPDGVVKMHADCRFIAAANTYGTGATHEYVGRTKIDAATVDRFIMLDWQYDEILERAIAGDNEWTNYVQKIRAACKAAGVKHLVTPRASLRGNALLASGVDREAVINMTVRKGLSDDQWNNVKIKAGVR